MKISEKTKQKNVDYMCDEIKHVIVEYGDRGPGSIGELKALDHMAEELKGVSDSVTQESFTLHPGAFMGWTYFTATFLLMATIATFFSPIATFILVILAFIPMVSQFVFYGTLLDCFFKKKTSGNILAVKKPEGEVKRRIVLNGHSDAAYEWYWHQKGGFKLFVASLVYPFLGLLFMLGLSIARLATGNAVYGAAEGVIKYLNYASLVFIPAYIFFYFFSNTSRPVPGANDNLTACYMAISTLKALTEENINLKNTEVCCLITGSEEAGLRGAKAFCKAHPDFDKDVETIFVTYETLREVDHLHIYSRDLNSLVKCDKQVCQLVHDAGKKNDIKLTYGSVFCGATDAAAFAQAGFKSAAIAGMSAEIKDYYHTRADNFDNLSKECLAKVYDITLDMIESYDNNGLPQVTYNGKK